MEEESDFTDEQLDEIRETLVSRFVDYLEND